MCDQKILQSAIESYLEDEEKLFGGLNTGGKPWYKKGVENILSAQSQSIVEPTMNTKVKTDAANTEAANTEAANTEAHETVKEKAQHAVESTKGFFKKHAGFFGFVLGVVTCAGAQAGYEAYKNRSESATSGSEQA